MLAQELVTVGHLDATLEQLAQRLIAALATGAGVSIGPPRLLSIEDVMQECGVSRPTVWRWMEKGKPGRHGGTITLQYYKFSVDKPRIPWPALAAFGQGLAFDLDSLSEQLPPLRLTG